MASVIGGVTLAPGGLECVVLSTGSEIKIRNLTDHKQIHSQSIADPVRQMIYSVDEDTLIALTIEGQIFTLVNPFCQNKGTEKPLESEESVVSHSKTVSVKEKLGRQETEKIVKDEQRVINKF